MGFTFSKWTFQRSHLYNRVLISVLAKLCDTCYIRQIFITKYKYIQYIYMLTIYV